MEYSGISPGEQIASQLEGGGAWANVKTDYIEEKQNILRPKWKDWSQSRVTRPPLGFCRSKLDLITVP